MGLVSGRPRASALSRRTLSISSENVNADHIVPSLGQHQGQLAGAAAEICHNAILDAVGFQLPGHIGEQRIIISCAVELVIK